MTLQQLGLKIELATTSKSLWLHKFTYNPIDSFNISKRFWSNLRIVNLRNLDIPLGNVSSTFCDKCKSVKFSKPLISSGNSSSLVVPLINDHDRKWYNGSGREREKNVFLLINTPNTQNSQLETMWSNESPFNCTSKASQWHQFTMNAYALFFLRSTNMLCPSHRSMFSAREFPNNNNNTYGIFQRLRCYVPFFRNLTIEKWTITTTYLC